MGPSIENRIAARAGSSSVETVRSFYLALLNELNQPGYNEAERSLLANRHLYYGRFLNPGLRNYFVETVIPNIARAIPFLIEEQRRPHILDLGCGLGMQSIIFASLGARVTGLDIREKAIDLCRKRQAYYEDRLQMKLDIEFIHGDFLQRRAEDFATRFDSLFSMAAFSCIRPLERTVDLVSAILEDDAKIFLYETNPSHPFKLLRRSPEPSPSDTVRAFERKGFSVCFKYGTCALPGAFWKSAPLNQAVMHPANNLLKKSLSLSFNYVLGLQRGKA